MESTHDDARIVGRKPKLRTWDVISLATVINLAGGGKSIRWLDSWGDIQFGVARGLTDENACTMHEADVRDMFLRITTMGFADRYIPVMHAAKLVGDGALCAD